MKPRSAGHLHVMRFVPMAAEIISTPRLSLRSALPADLDPLHERVFSDSEVMRFVFRGVPFDLDQSAAFFTSAFDHDATGLKLGVLIEKATSALIGFSGLMECRALDAPDYEIGFVLSQAAWGKGYATEIGHAQLKYGFGTVGCTRLLAQVATENHSSIAALKKIGMAFYGNLHSEGRGLRQIYVAHGRA